MVPFTLHLPSSRGARAWPPASLFGGCRACWAWRNARARPFARFVVPFKAARTRLRTFHKAVQGPAVLLIPQECGVPLVAPRLKVGYHVAHARRGQPAPAAGSRCSAASSIAAFNRKQSPLLADVTSSTVRLALCSISPRKPCSRSMGIRVRKDRSRKQLGPDRLASLLCRGCSAKYAIQGFGCVIPT